MVFSPLWIGWQILWYSVPFIPSYRVCQLLNKIKLKLKYEQCACEYVGWTPLGYIAMKKEISTSLVSALRQQQEEQRTLQMVSPYPHKQEGRYSNNPFFVTRLLVFGAQYPSILLVTSLNRGTWAHFYSTLLVCVVLPLSLEFLPDSIFEYETLRWDSSPIIARTNPCWYSNGPFITLSVIPSQLLDKIQVIPTNLVSFPKWWNSYDFHLIIKRMLENYSYK